MTGIIVVQGRDLSAEDIGQMQGLLAEHPDWGRTRLSEELCRRWDWRNARGRIKDMAARTLLLKLERSGHIRLPGPEGAPAAAFVQRVPKSPRAGGGARSRDDPLRVARPAAFVCECRRAGIG